MHGMKSLSHSECEADIAVEICEFLQDMTASGFVQSNSVQFQQLH